MRTKLLIFISATALCCATVSARTDEADANDPVLRDRDVAAAQRSVPTESLGDLRRAKEIIGREIVDEKDQKLGRVKELALDLQNGRVAEVIIAPNGALGMDQKLVAVPPSSFASDRTRGALRFDGDANVLRNSPEFNLSQWNEATQYVEIRETYQRFGVAPYFVHDQQPALGTASTHGVENYYSSDRPAPLPELGYIARATRLTGTTAMNSLDERLGKINDYVLDLHDGRIVEVVLATGGFLGIDETFRAVPPTAFHWNSDHTSLALETSSEVFRASPHFKASEWGYALEPASIGDIYDNYHVQPYFLTRDMDLNAQNVRTRDQQPAPRPDLSDDEISRQIHEFIMTNNGIVSTDARNIKIVTVDGKVTLSGPVDTAEEKRLIGEAAAKVVSADKVDNQLEVHATPLNVPFSNSTGQTQ